MTVQVAHDVTGRLAGRLPEFGRSIVYDTANSRGSWLVDARDGRRYLDLATFLGSAPLGANPPGLADDPQFMAELARVATGKPANPQMATSHLADFVEVFVRVLGDPELPYLFFVEGGAAAVENALKTAFDWKSRHNEARGRPASLGGKVLHLTGAFHGRTGYALSLTNTDKSKTARFPLFDWPRIEAPVVRFPLAEHLHEVVAAERRALAQAEIAFETHRHDIACFIAEPIQGEGGDNHLRPEFLLAMQDLCRRYDALFVLDEVQTGVGTTGTAWAYRGLGLAPDVVAFGKKAQVGGIMAGRRLDEVTGHVFATTGRINSTWGGGLTDMVRARRLLELIERDALFARSARTGEWLLARLVAAQERWPALLSNARGRGLMCAFDLPDGRLRERTLAGLTEAGVLALACGSRSIRLRPPLSVTTAELAHGLAALERVISGLSKREL
jgi:L-lysine 6-transaminase